MISSMIDRVLLSIFYFFRKSSFFCLNRAIFTMKVPALLIRIRTPALKILLGVKTLESVEPFEANKGYDVNNESR